MRWILLFVLCLACVGCEGPAQETEVINTYKVEQLFTVDDCKVYRFQDTGHYHYFVIRNGETMTDIQSDDTSYPETIPTR